MLQPIRQVLTYILTQTAWKNSYTPEPAKGCDYACYSANMDPVKYSCFVITWTNFIFPIPGKALPLKISWKLHPLLQLEMKRMKWPNICSQKQSLVLSLRGGTPVGRGVEVYQLCFLTYRNSCSQTSTLCLLLNDQFRYYRLSIGPLCCYRWSSRIGNFDP
jgi:hypothetical protein